MGATSQQITSGISTASTKQKRLQNKAIRITMCLRKYDHVSLYRCQLNWLPISYHIMFKSSCAMYRHYYHDKQHCLLLNPPIVFGAQHSYNTRCKDCFANPPSYHLSTTKNYLCSSATTWWNSLLKSIPIDCNYNSFVFSVKDFYLN